MWGEEQQERRRVEKEDEERVARMKRNREVRKQAAAFWKAQDEKEKVYNIFLGPHTLQISLHPPSQFFASVHGGCASCDLSISP